MLVPYTIPGGQMCKGLAYTLVAYTCSGKMSTGRAYKSVAYTCSGQMSKGLLTRWSHMPAVSKCLMDVYTHWAQTLTRPT